jgi:hypothetical protein
VRGHPQPTPQAMAAGRPSLRRGSFEDCNLHAKGPGSAPRGAAERAATKCATRASSRPMELLGALAAIRMMDRRDGAEEARGQMPAAKGGRIGCVDAHHKASNAPTLERLPLQSTSQADPPSPRSGQDTKYPVLYLFFLSSLRLLALTLGLTGGLTPLDTMQNCAKKIQLEARLRPTCSLAKTAKVIEPSDSQ